MKLLFPINSHLSIKFLIRPPNTRLFALPYQSNAATKSFGNNTILPDGQQEAKRARLHFSDSSADAPMVDSEEDEEWKGNRSVFRLTKASFNFFPARFASPAVDGIENLKPKPQQIHTLRIISPLRCFLCQAHIKLHKLWTLYTHLRFVHPRFEFRYEVFR